LFSLRFPPQDGDEGDCLHDPPNHHNLLTEQPDYSSATTTAKPPRPSPQVFRTLKKAAQERNLGLLHLSLPLHYPPVLIVLQRDGHGGVPKLVQVDLQSYTHDSLLSLLAL